MKRSNWLYKIYKSEINTQNPDICQFITGIMGKIFTYIILISLALLMLPLFFSMLVFLFDVFLNIVGVGSFIPYFGEISAFGAVFLAILLVASIVILVAIFSNKISNNIKGNIVYRSWKDKACYKIDFKD